MCEHPKNGLKRDDGARCVECTEAPKLGGDVRPQQGGIDAPAGKRRVLHPDGTPYCAEEMELLHEQIETYEKKDIPEWVPPSD